MTVIDADMNCFQNISSNVESCSLNIKNSNNNNNKSNIWCNVKYVVKSWSSSLFLTLVY